MTEAINIIHSNINEIASTVIVLQVAVVPGTGIVVAFMKRHHIREFIRRRKQ